MNHDKWERAMLTRDCAAYSAHGCLKALYECGDIAEYARQEVKAALDRYAAAQKEMDDAAQEG